METVWPLTLQDLLGNLRYWHLKVEIYRKKENIFLAGCNSWWRFWRDFTQTIIQTKYKQGTNDRESGIRQRSSLQNYLIVANFHQVSIKSFMLIKKQNCSAKLMLWCKIILCNLIYHLLLKLLLGNE
jgi:hypothetical protein